LKMATKSLNVVTKTSAAFYVPISLFLCFSFVFVCVWIMDVQREFTRKQKGGDACNFLFPNKQGLA